MASSTHRACQLAILLSKAPGAPSANIIADLVIRAQKIARAAKRHGENQCNFPMTEEQIARADKRIANQAKKLNADFALVFLGREKPSIEAEGGDPRGPCAYLFIPGTQGDSLHDKGLAIY